MATNHSAFVSSRRVAWITLLLLALTSAIIVIVPVWLIQPFSPQSERGIALSYLLKRWSPLITLGALLAGLFLGASLWRATRRWWLKATLVVILIPLLALTWFARQNHFEWMFKPAVNTSYAKANDVTFLTDEDVVMSVEKNGEFVAYPIRFMAYHHVVQDVVGGTPVVATY
jgi:hypothetical protein